MEGVGARVVSGVGEAVGTAVGAPVGVAVFAAVHILKSSLQVKVLGILTTTSAVMEHCACTYAARNRRTRKYKFSCDILDA